MKQQANNRNTSNFMYSFEDLKEELMNAGDQESLIVPEEIEEELPLRIRTLQYGEDDDSYRRYQ